MSVIYQNLFVNHVGIVPDNFPEGFTPNSLRAATKITVDFNVVTEKLKFLQDGEPMAIPMPYQDRPHLLLNDILQGKVWSNLTTLLSIDELFHKFSTLGSEADLHTLSLRLKGYLYIDSAPAFKYITTPEAVEMLGEIPAPLAVLQKFEANRLRLHEFMAQNSIAYSVL